MLRTTAAAAALVICLLLAACGSNQDSSSSSSGTKPAGQASAPTPAGQAATPASSASSSKTSAKAADKAAATKAAKATPTPTKGAAAVKAEVKKDKVSATEANRRLRQLSKEVGAKQAATLKAQTAKDKATLKAKGDAALAKARKQAAALKPKGKAGGSDIVSVVKQRCTTTLADAQGALKGGAAAKALPGALQTAIAKLTFAASSNSPYASGTTGDAVARVRTTEVVRAMKAALPAARKYAAAPSAANRTALSQALTGLKNNAYGNLLRSCAVS